MAYGERRIIQLSEGDDYGVYVTGWRNNIGTPLAFRGTLDEAVHLNVELCFGGIALVDRRTGERRPTFSGKTSR